MSEQEKIKKQTEAAYQKAYQANYRKAHKRVYITVSEKEYSELERRAKQEKTKVATLAKNMAFAYMQTQNLVPEKIEKELKDLKFLIRNIANNVNQVTHYSHTINTLVNEQELLLELQRLEESVRNYTLGKLKT